jgi:SAM-dependent methyltransferase
VNGTGIEFEQFPVTGRNPSVAARERIWFRRRAAYDQRFSMEREFNPDEPELMDRPQPVSEELETDLLNLVSLNRYFGSHRLVRSFLRQWIAPGQPYRILDLATGAGDIPRLIADWARERDISVRIDAVDANPSTLEIAGKHSAGYPEIEFVRDDVLTYDSPLTYDLVCCSLALHHFSREDATRLLRRCRALSHRFVLVADLERCAATLASVYAVTALIYREPMTQFDGRLSARRAFSFAELQALAEEAGWKDFGHKRFLFCRQALWLDQRIAGEIPVLADPLSEGLPCPAA